MKFILFLCSFVCLTTLLNAQPEHKITHDTTYYVSYADKLVGRFYFKQRYAKFKVTNTEDGSVLRYYPDKILSMGVGAAYGWFTLNLSYGFGFLNPDQIKIKTQKILVYS